MPSPSLLRKATSPEGRGKNVPLGSPFGKDSPGRGRWHESARRGMAGERQRD